MAIRIFTFVDDILGGGRSKDEASRISSQVKKDLELSGFVTCPEKSHWEPTQKGKHLGFFYRFRNWYFFNTPYAHN